MPRPYGTGPYGVGAYSSDSNIISMALRIGVQVGMRAAAADLDPMGLSVGVRCGMAVRPQLIQVVASWASVQCGLTADAHPTWPETDCCVPGTWQPGTAHWWQWAA